MNLTEFLSLAQSLIHTGGQGALIAMLWLGWKVARAAIDAFETLTRIEKHMAGEAKVRAVVAHRLEELRRDVDDLPDRIVTTMVKLRVIK